jgi:hypothetical protein
VAPWVALAIYPLGNAVATAVGRSGFGLHQALASRYVSVAMLFWVSLVGIAASVGWRPAKRRLAVLLSASLITVLVGATWISGWATLRAYLGRAAEHPLAEQAILLAIDDERTLSFVTPAREQIAGIYSFLAATHHVPFDRPRPQAGVGDLEVELSAAPSPEVVGRFVGGRRAGDGYALAEGWVGLDRGQVDAVVLVDEHGQVHGEMVVGLPSRARASGRSGATTGWAGFVRLGPEATQLTAYARIRDQAVFNQLEGSHTAPAATPDG